MFLISQIRMVLPLMMSDYKSQLDLILDLEARHDDLLVRLDELDRRVAKTLSDCLALRRETGLNENNIGPIQTAVMRLDFSDFQRTARP
jgi:hypothetical protein